jgi:hypothetical protein
MLKIIDKNGKLLYILGDEDSEPQDIDDLTKLYQETDKTLDNQSSEDSESKEN